MSRDKDQRIAASPISDYAKDLLVICARLNKRSQAQQASILLTEAILNHEEEINKQVQYLADEAGVRFEEMWQSLKSGNLL